MPRRASTAILAVLALWLAAVAAVGTGGEFPLSDDWSYAHAVRSLVDGRGLDLLPWTGASLLLQALYGAAVCKLTGFSYETLRLTTLAMSAAGIAVFHLLLLQLGAGAVLAASGALALALSPLWFNLSFTFMTDVPFAALSLAALWLYLRALETRSSRTWLLAGAVAAAAFLIRQHALSIAAAAALVALLPAVAVQSWRERIGHAAAAVALPLVATAAWALWAVGSDSVPLGLQNKLSEAAGASLLSMSNVAFRSSVTLGFLMLPWAVLPLRGAGVRACFVVSTVILAITAIFVFAREGALMFYLTNVMSDFRVGALTTRDTLFLGWPLRPNGGDRLHLIVTVVSVLSAAALVARIVVPLAASRQRGALLCASALALYSIGTLLQAHYYFDRYLLLAVPLAIACIVAVTPQSRPGPVFALLLGALSLYSVAGTHDYLAWNRARWSLLAELEERGITARQIDGGVEYNAERLAAALGTTPSDAQARSGQSERVRSWWWVEDDEWIVSFRPLGGYAVAESRSWSRWLPPLNASVLLLQRRDEVAAPNNPAAVPADPAAVPADPAAVPADPTKTGATE